MRICRLISVAVTGLVCAAPAQAAAAAKEVVLYSFTSSATGYPLGTVYFMKGALYGAGTSDGRAGHDGQIFKLTRSAGAWKQTAPLAFDGTDGSEPYPGPIGDSNGWLFGTTATGDAHNGGNAFELRRARGKWIHKTIWAFGGRPHDGKSPTADLVMDKDGNLFGTTYSGGNNELGTVFELSNSNGRWVETILHKFADDGADGAEPYAGLLRGGNHCFYGTTMAGGRFGYGTVYELFQSGDKWTVRVLYSFTGGADGSEPWGRLISDENGTLYGTTAYGGISNNYSNVGTVFELVRSGGKWKEMVLHNFGAKGDGWDPLAGLRWGPAGQIYGTTSEGGSPGPGTVFELRRSSSTWVETVLHDFGETGDGNYPQGKIAVDSNGALYGTTVFGGTDNRGTVWKITP